MIDSLKRTFGKLLLSPFFLAILNFAILFLGLNALRETWFSGASTVHHIHEATELWEGFGTIIIGFGVLCEERKSLAHIFKLKEFSDTINSLCHDYGVLFVIFGVLIEVAAWLIKIPNEVLDTEAIEWGIMEFAAVIAAVAVLVQFRFFWRITSAALKSGNKSK